MNKHDATEVAYKNGFCDGIREMQDGLTRFFEKDDILKYNEVDADYINEVIDQIAKEMLERKDESNS